MKDDFWDSDPDDELPWEAGDEPLPDGSWPIWGADGDLAACTYHSDAPFVSAEARAKYVADLHKSNQRLRAVVSLFAQYHDLEDLRRGVASGDLHAAKRAAEGCAPELP